MRLDPLRDLLARTGKGEYVVGIAQDADEQLDVDALAGINVDSGGSAVRGEHDLHGLGGDYRHRCDGKSTPGGSSNVHCAIGQGAHKKCATELKGKA